MFKLYNLKTNKFVKYFIINLFILFTFFYFILNEVIIKNSFHLAKEINLEIYLFAILLSILQIFFNNYRWLLFLIKLKNINFTQLLKNSYITSLLNQILPSSIGGEAYKIYITNKYLNSFSRAISVIFFEKIIVFMSLIILIILSYLIFYNLNIEWIENTIFGLLIVTILVSLIIYLLFKFIRLEVNNYIINKLKIIFYDSFFFLNDHIFIFKIFFISSMGHINLLLIFYIITYSIGVKINIFDLSFVFFMIFLITQMPVSIGGWGVRETLSVSFLNFIGFTNEESFTVSTLFGITLLLAYLPALIFIIKDINQFTIKK